MTVARLLLDAACTYRALMPADEKMGTVLAVWPHEGDAVHLPADHPDQWVDQVRVALAVIPHPAGVALIAEATLSVVMAPGMVNRWPAVVVNAWTPADGCVTLSRRFVPHDQLNRGRWLWLDAGPCRVDGVPEDATPGRTGDPWQDVIATVFAATLETLGPHA